MRHVLTPSYSARVEKLTLVSDLDRAEQTTDSSPFLLVRKTCMKHLLRICGHHNLPPGAMQIELVDIPADITYHFRGGFGNVLRCTNQGLEVAVKDLRLPPDGDQRKRTMVSHSRFALRPHGPVCLPQPMQRYYKEAITWKFLTHQNVLPFLGVPKNRTRFKFAMVSEWMVNGTINEFVNARTDVNRFKLVRSPCLARCTHRSEPCCFCSWRMRPRD